MDYRFIDNIGDYFNPGFFTTDFLDKVKRESEKSSDEIKEIIKRFKPLSESYTRLRNKIINGQMATKYKIQATHEFNTVLLSMLGYDSSCPYEQWFYLNDSSVIPVRHILKENNQVSMLIMEMQPMIQIGETEPDGLFQQHYDETTDSEGKTTKEQRYRYTQWSEVIKNSIPEGYAINPSIINDAITEIFLLTGEQKPKYILLLGGNKVFLLEAENWFKGSYIIFDLELLISDSTLPTNKEYPALFYLLTSKEALSAEGQEVLMSKLLENSLKNAYEVTKDLKSGVINAVEALANEALYYMKEVQKLDFDETDDTFEEEMKDDCLSIIYRLLFIFYAEAKPELGILPMKDEIYLNGYSLEKLRDMEQNPMFSSASLNGYYFHDSLWKLFRLIREGYNENANVTSYDYSFSVRHIDSPLFDDEKLKHLKGIKFRNSVWQEIIRSLSLSKEQKGKKRGRISYVNLGVNQLGSVYESLLAYRGFYAEEDYIEVYKAGNVADGTFLIPRSRMGDFVNSSDPKKNEVLKDENGEIIIHTKGTFVYRLNGRDRKKSASYYTPEVLTKSTVKYTLKGFQDKLETGEMKASELLKLKILEPAMGAAAFQNEVINQLAEMYIIYREKELGRRVPPNERKMEIQKVKALIATQNTYGVDLNKTAIELGKLSLWLNVMHKDMETPFFGHRLAWGNAVIGAWLKVYDKEEVLLKDKKRGKYLPTSWWEKAPHLIHITSGMNTTRKKNEIYHFLLPDKNMLAVLNIKEQKNEFKSEAKQMSDIRKAWTNPLTEEDFIKMQKISRKIDILLKDYIKFQSKIENATKNHIAVWGQNGNAVQRELIDYNFKQSLLETRMNSSSAYYKLKTVMDYWCSLWYWEYEDASLIPSRDEYWQDVESILDIDLGDGKSKQTNLFGEEEFNFGELFTEEGEANVIDDEEIEEERIDAPKEIVAAVTRTEAEEIIKSFENKQELLFSKGKRFEIVHKYAEQYRFFHPMLEFIEVWWLRDGFDIICGNPPWLKIEFEEKDIISEKFPQISIRNISAPDIAKTKALFLKDLSLKKIYNEEQIECSCTSEFLNSISNYPLLQGQQTDLYKCILENCLELSCNNGYIGILHPESIYDDPNGQAFREEIYKRLIYHFQYQNALNLFDIAHRRKYSSNVYGCRKEYIDFININNIFHPITVDNCFNSNGHESCYGIKDNQGKWNLLGHKNRIIHYDNNAIELLSKTFEEGNSNTCAKLVSIHTQNILSIIYKLSSSNNIVKDFENITTECLHETGAPENGIIERRTCYPDFNQYQMIYNAPQIFVSNPYYKTPRSQCKNKADYDCILLHDLKSNIQQRTNYIPSLPLLEYKKIFSEFRISESESRNWLDTYKVGFRKMINQAGERSLICAILPPKTAHVHGLISCAFKDLENTIEFTGLCSSLVMDFYLKTIATQNLTPSRLSAFPIHIDKKYRNALYSRTLLLNCISDKYSDLWIQLWDDSFRKEIWSIEDNRLKSFDRLSQDWKISTPSQNFFERRMALVEIDVISAMALGLNLEDLELMYEIQFPVLQQNENDTWYDQKGNIVFTCSKGLVGVGVDRPVWNKIKNQEEGDIYEHTIDPRKSELYGGEKLTYYAPYTKCDRIEDYRRAWAHFEKIFNKQE